jgi:hypothetical protein
MAMVVLDGTTGGTTTCRLGSYQVTRRMESGGSHLEEKDEVRRPKVQRRPQLTAVPFDENRSRVSRELVEA